MSDARAVADLAASLVWLAIIVASPIPLVLRAAVSDDGRRTWSEVALSCLVGWALVLTALCLALGLAGALRLAPMLWASAGIAALGGTTWRTGRASLPRLPPELSSSDRVLAGCVVAVVAGLGLRAIGSAVVEVDSLGYHLPAVAQWTHDGAVTPLGRPDQTAHYPYGWELLMIPFVLPTGSDWLVCVPNALALMVLALSVYRVGRELGASRSAALCCALAACSLSLVRRQIGTARVDLALAGWTTSALAGCLAARRTRNDVDLATAIAAIALAMGTKMSGLPYAGWLAITAICFGFVRSPAGSARRLVGALVLGVPVAAFWYLRNLVEVGNPLGLVPLSVAGVTVFEGAIARERVVGATVAAVFHPSERSHWAILAAMWRDQLGLPFLASSLLALEAVRGAIRARRRGPWFVATFALGALALYVITPYSGALGPGRAWSPRAAENLRYALPFVCAVVGLAAAGVPPRAPHGLLAAVGVALVAGLGSWVVVSASVAAMVAIASRGIPMRLRPIALTALGAAAFFGLVTLAGDHARDRHRSCGPIWTLLDRNVPPGASVGVTYSHVRLCLYGPRFTRRIVDVAGAQASGRLAEHLRIHHVSAVAVGPAGGRSTRRSAWHGDAQSFRRVGGDDPRRGLVLYVDAGIATPSPDGRSIGARSDLK